jgi:hypothetical protein
MRQNWSAMLQMVPSMSKEKAWVIASNPLYSCPLKLSILLNDRTVPLQERILLLQDSFIETKKKSNNCLATKSRKQVKLSKVIFNLMTSLDPHALIGDD